MKSLIRAFEWQQENASIDLKGGRWPC